MFSSFFEQIKVRHFVIQYCNCKSGVTTTAMEAAVLNFMAFEWFVIFTLSWQLSYSDCDDCQTPMNSFTWVSLISIRHYINSFYLSRWRLIVGFPSSQMFKHWNVFTLKCCLSISILLFFLSNCNANPRILFWNNFEFKSCFQVDRSLFMPPYQRRQKSIVIWFRRSIKWELIKLFSTRNH